MKIPLNYSFLLIFSLNIFYPACSAQNRKVTLKPNTISEKLLIGEWVKDRDFFGDIQELQRVNADYYRQEIINKNIYDTYETVVAYKQLANTLMEGSWQITITDDQFRMSDLVSAKVLKEFRYTSIEKPGGNYVSLKGTDGFEFFSVVNPDYILHYSVSSCGALYIPYRKVMKKRYASP